MAAYSPFAHEGTFSHTRPAEIEGLHAQSLIILTMLKCMLVVKVSFILVDSQTMSDECPRPPQKRKTQGSINLEAHIIRITLLHSN